MIKLKLDNLKEAVRNIESWQYKKLSETGKAIKGSALAITREAKMKAPVNVGRLRADIQHDVTKTDAGRIIQADVFNTVSYAPYVEFGTKGNVNVPDELQDYAKTFQGREGGTFDELLESITDWARKKGIPEGAVYPIARKIAREGVKAQPYLYPAYEQERPKLIKRLEDILNGK